MIRAFLILLLLCGSSLAATNDYVFRARLDGTPDDEIGLTGTATDVTYATGQLGQSGVFNGTTSFVSYGDNHDAGTGDQSIAFWINTTQATTFRVAQKRGTGLRGTQDGWQVSWSDSAGWGNTFWDDGSGNYVAIDSSVTDLGMRDGNWHHSVFVWDESAQDIEVYVDEVAQNPALEVSGTVGDVTTSRELAIGAAWDDAGTQSQFCDGQVDDVRIYDRVITDAEALYLYHLRYATDTPIQVLGQ